MGLESRMNEGAEILGAHDSDEAMKDVKMV